MQFKDLLRSLKNFTKSELFQRYFARIFLMFNKTLKILSRIWEQLFLGSALKLAADDNDK